MRRSRNFSETVKDRVGREALIKQVVNERHPDHDRRFELRCMLRDHYVQFWVPDGRFWPDRVRQAGRGQAIAAADA